MIRRASVEVDGHAVQGVWVDPPGAQPGDPPLAGLFLPPLDQPWHELRELPEDPLQRTEATVAEMTRLATEGGHHPGIVALAAMITRDLPSHAHVAEADAIFRAVKAHLRYAYDPRGQERLQHPVFSFFTEGQGDCDDHAILVSALAIAAGHGAAFRAVVADPESDEFSHVYAMIGLRTAQGEVWYAADTCFGDRLGWEPTGARVRAVRDWTVVSP